MQQEVIRTGMSIGSSIKNIWKLNIFFQYPHVEMKPALLETTLWTLCNL